MTNCRFCGEEGYWKDIGGKWVLFNNDGSEHRETCEHFNQYEKEMIEFTLQSIVSCPKCGIKISIAGLKKRIERIKAENEAMTGQDCGFGDLKDYSEIVRSYCINENCKGIGYVIVC